MALFLASSHLVSSGDSTVLVTRRSTGDARSVPPEFLKVFAWWNESQPAHGRHSANEFRIPVASLADSDITAQGTPGSGSAVGGTGTLGGSSVAPPPPGGSGTGGEVDDGGGDEVDDGECEDAGGCDGADNGGTQPPVSDLGTCSPALKVALESPAAYTKLIQKCVPSSADLAALDLCVETEILRLGSDQPASQCLSCIKTLLAALQSLSPAGQETCVTDPTSGACYALMSTDLNTFAYCSGIQAVRSVSLSQHQLVLPVVLLLIITSAYVH